VRYVFGGGKLHGQSGAGGLGETEELHCGISSGQFHNQAATGAEAALTAMLGRATAYRGRELTWDKLLKT
jgi:hypothetical protein